MRVYIHIKTDIRKPKELCKKVHDSQIHHMCFHKRIVRHTGKGRKVCIYVYHTQPVYKRMYVRKGQECVFSTLFLLLFSTRGMKTKKWKGKKINKFVECVLKGRWGTPNTQKILVYILNILICWYHSKWLTYFCLHMWHMCVHNDKDHSLHPISDDDDHHHNRISF